MVQAVRRGVLTAVVTALMGAFALAATAFGVPGESRVSAVPQSAMSPIPVGDPEIPGIGRGQYRWSGETVWGTGLRDYFPFPGMTIPAGAAPYTQGAPSGSISYYRMSWRTLEPTEGRYDFSVLDARIAEAAAQGERTGFRVFAVDTCCSVHDQSFPTYLNDRMSTWRFDDGDGVRDDGDIDAVVPDWNDPDYLAAMSRLLAALGARYDRDDRVAFVDMMGYGNYGEWHLSPLSEQMPAAFGPISDANARALVDANLAAFPSTTVLTLTSQAAAFDRAMSYPAQRVGVRADCLGDPAGGWAWPLMRQQATRAASTAASSLQRWRDAPLVTEWCQTKLVTAGDLAGYPDLAGDADKSLYAIARKHVADWHVSLLSSGNFPATNSPQAAAAMTRQEFEDWAAANKLSGYRLSAALAAAPTSVRRGGRLTIDTTWTNAGAAPTYQRWVAAVELWPVGRTYAALYADVASPAGGNLDLRTLKSAQENPVAAGRVTMTVPSTTPPGEYEIRVVLWNQPQKPGPTGRMPDSYYQTPVPLAQHDGVGGHYKIGTIRIR